MIRTSDRLPKTPCHLIFYVKGLDMVSLNLTPDLDARLTAIAIDSGKPKAFHIEAALAEYLDDLEDHALAEEAMRDYDPSQNVSHEQLKRQLDLHTSA